MALVVLLALATGAVVIVGLGVYFLLTFCFSYTNSSSLSSTNFLKSLRVNTSSLILAFTFSLLILIGPSFLTTLSYCLAATRGVFFPLALLLMTGVDLPSLVFLVESGVAYPQLVQASFLGTGVALPFLFEGVTLPLSVVFYRRGVYLPFFDYLVGVVVPLLTGVDFPFFTADLLFFGVFTAFLEALVGLMVSSALRKVVVILSLLALLVLLSTARVFLIEGCFLVA